MVWASSFLGSIFVSGQQSTIKFGRVRKTIRARCNHIQLDYFYIEVDYFLSRWVTFHRGGLLSIEVDYFLSRWVTFYRGGLFSIDLEILYFIIEQLSSWITIMLDNNILVRLVELSLKVEFEAILSSGER